MCPYVSGTTAQQTHASLGCQCNTQPIHFGCWHKIAGRETKTERRIVCNTGETSEVQGDRIKITFLMPQNSVPVTGAENGRNTFIGGNGKVSLLPTFPPTFL